MDQFYITIWDSRVLNLRPSGPKILLCPWARHCVLVIFKWAKESGESNHIHSIHVYIFPIWEDSWYWKKLIIWKNREHIWYIFYMVALIAGFSTVLCPWAKHYPVLSTGSIQDWNIVDWEIKKPNKQNKLRPICTIFNFTHLISSAWNEWATRPSEICISIHLKKVFAQNRIHGWKFSGFIQNSGFWVGLSIESQPKNADLGCF